MSMHYVPHKYRNPHLRIPHPTPAPAKPIATKPLSKFGYLKTNPEAEVAIPVTLIKNRAHQTLRSRKIKPSMPKMPWEDKP